MVDVTTLFGQTPKHRHDVDPDRSSGNSIVSAKDANLIRGP